MAAAEKIALRPALPADAPVLAELFRASVEQPADKRTPHILIRHFAAQALLVCASSGSIVLSQIDAKALNSNSRTIFDPPRRDFLRKHINVPHENVTKFPAWREYLSLNVLGFPPEPVYIEAWPEEVPQPKAA